ncbi:MAG: hypothetical protein JO132_07780 [Streptosporangiaceae bacterium]|nr:hypothetical protein [Streptosporangiaceae bacterium]
MISWNDFKAQQPEIARAGADLLYHFGVGLAFLGTVRADGGPRLHPMCPLLTGAGLYAFIVPSPKQRDLHRDGRYAMHSFPLDDNEDAFYLSGAASHVPDLRTRTRLAQQFADERSDLAVPPPDEEEHLFEFQVQTAMLTRTSGHGDPHPQHTIWHAA